MESYREVARCLGFIITESTNKYNETVYHIRKPDGEKASTEFGTMDEPMGIMQEIEEILTAGDTQEPEELGQDRKARKKKKEYSPRLII